MTPETPGCYVAIASALWTIVAVTLLACLILW